MLNKFFLKNKTLKAVITAAMLSFLISGCGNNASDTVTKEDINLSASGDVSDKEPTDLSADSEDNKDSDDKDKDNEEKDNKDKEDTEDTNIELKDDSDVFVNNDTNTYSHTIMVYMVGSDLESEHGSASADLTEMLEAKPDLDNNNVVVFTGGASSWQIPGIEADKNYILELKEDDFHKKESVKAANMGDPNSLSTFIRYCFKEYDTDKYSLILWNHGAGPVMGFGIDENFEDIMSLVEIQEALDSSMRNSDKKLEFIGFDACLMSSLEVADTLAPYANYMIASQETEPGFGWNYEFLSKLSDPGMNGAGLGKEIIDSYMDYCNEKFEEYPKYYSDITLSCMDLNKYDAAEKAIDTYFNEVGTTLDTDTLPEIIRKRNKLRNFGTFSSSYNYSLVDSMQLIASLADKNTKKAAKEAVLALQDMVVYKQTNMKNANGISVCFPYNTEEMYQEASLKVNEHIEFAPKYGKFLNNVYALQNGETIATDWDVTDAETNVEQTEVTEANITSKGSDITLQLTKEQQENFAGAAFFILAKAKNFGYADENEDERADDLYFYVYCGKNVQMDEDGKLHALYNNNILYLKGTSDENKGELSEIPMILVDEDITNTYEKRYSTVAVLQNWDDGLDAESAKLQIIRDAEHPDGYVRSAVPTTTEDSDIHTPSKQLIDVDDYTFMSTGVGARYVTKDADGNTLPFYDWEYSGTMMGLETNISNGIEFVSTPIPDPENYACMFLLYDSQGNMTSSDLIPLK